MATLLEVAFLSLLALGFGALLFALVSLADGVRFLRRMRRALRGGPTFQPPVVVLLPVRGSDPDFGETLEALRHQDYPDYRLLFIVDPGDPAEARIGGSLRDRGERLVLTEPEPHCSGKIAALLTGLKHLTPEDEVLVFADSDILPDEAWLAHLVDPLKDPQVGATTGYRWYLPRSGGLGPALQTAWNSAAGNILFHPRWVYLWGGSTAIRRETFRGLHVEARWRQALSDDMVLTQALKAAGGHIRFVPRATVANRTEGDLTGVLRWTHRQACMALLYAPSMARLTLPYGLYGGAVLLAVLTAALLPVYPPLALPLVLLLSPVYLGLAKGFLRRLAFREAMPSVREEFQRHRGWFALATLLLPFVMLRNVRRARRMREFTWRGRVYRFGPGERVEIAEA